MFKIFSLFANIFRNSLYSFGKYGTIYMLFAGFSFWGLLKHWLHRHYHKLAEGATEKVKTTRCTQKAYSSGLTSQLNDWWCLRVKVLPNLVLMRSLTGTFLYLKFWSSKSRRSRKQGIKYSKVQTFEVRPRLMAHIWAGGIFGENKTIETLPRSNLLEKYASSDLKIKTSKVIFMNNGSIIVNNCSLPQFIFCGW